MLPTKWSKLPYSHRNDSWHVLAECPLKLPLCHAQAMAKKIELEWIRLPVYDLHGFFS